MGDSKTEAAFSAYYNRPVIVEFLKSAAYDSPNILRDNLYVMLTCLEIVGAMRGRAAFHDKLTTRLRFFSASSTLDKWSNMDMAQVCARDVGARNVGVSCLRARLTLNPNTKPPTLTPKAAAAHDIPLEPA